MLTLFGVFFTAGLPPPLHPISTTSWNRGRKEIIPTAKRLNNSCCRLTQRIFSANHQACLVPDSQEQALGQWAVASTFSKGLRGDPNYYVQQSCRNFGKLLIPNKKKVHGKLGLKWSLERNLVIGGMGMEKAHFKLKLLRNSRINGGSTWLRCEICFFYSISFCSLNFIKQFWTRGLTEERMLADSR